MFKKAIEAHGPVAKARPALKQSSLPSGNHDQTHSRPISSAFGPQGPLQPSKPASLNSQGSRQSSFNSSTSSGLKRTASGLAKAIGSSSQDSFQDLPPLPGSQTNPFVIDENRASMQSTLKQTQQPVVFHEDDFDSDIDLEFENPSSKTAALYPELPKASTVNYPNLNDGQPEAKKARGPSYESNSKQNMPPPSSAPLDWSSSPIEHQQSATAVKKPNASVTAFVASATSSNANANIKKSSPTTPLQPPPKRGTLPWLTHTAETQSQNDLPAYKPPNRPNSKVLNSYRSQDQTGSSPQSYPWNTSASALKEQQRQLRKSQKESKKANEPDEPPTTTIIKKSAGVSRPCLSHEQKNVLDLVVDGGKSVFFTGSAGTGKSVLMREIISVMRKKHAREPDRVAITASTGLAACNVGGVTLHSFAGIGLGKEDVPELVKKIRRNQKAKHRWMRTKVLIVDEISMVDGELFDKLEEIARRIRNNGRPFGGIQLVVTGDFFQLPPVPDHGKEATFAFDAQQWKEVIEHTIGLHHVFRQRDPTFANMLNEMREGRMTTQSVNTWRKLQRKLDWESEVAATELFPLRTQVEKANNERMTQLNGEVKRFEAKDGGTITDVTQRTKLLQNCMAPELLELKKGSQVMLIKNIDDSLVNGSLGVVVGFMNEAKFDEYNNDPEGFLEVQNSRPEDLNPEQLKRKRLMHLQAGGLDWPLVRFSNADGTTRDLLCNRETWKIELPNGEVQASRAQVPLILAWALSIHKAQGQTLERVKVDLGKIFEKGQAYVALSRATTMEGLQVLNFDPNKVKAHVKVKDFYAGLSRAEQAVGAYA